MLLFLGGGKVAYLIPPFGTFRLTQNNFLAIKDAQKRSQEELDKIVADGKIDPRRLLPEEARFLDADTVADQLRRYVAVAPSASNESLLVPTPFTADDGRHTYYKIEKALPKENGQYMRLAEVLAQTYHIQPCCRVLEVSTEEFKEYLWDGDHDSLPGCGEEDRGRGASYKPLDYFAIRLIEKDKGTNEEIGTWLFCLQSRYDRDFDVAKIEVLHPGMAGSSQSAMNRRWEEAVKKLDKIFIENPGVGTKTPIEQYAT